jgi:glycosyltransferase involved in cell wall biosynthesis
MKTPRISVLTPCYNAAEFLRESIESVLKQTFQDFEFIIINDGSTDNTPEILHEYARVDNRIKILNQPNGGIVIALNHGLSEARGEWIARLDADDVAMNERFEKQLSFVEKRPNIVLLGSGCILIDQNGRSIKKYLYSSENKQITGGKSSFPHSSAFFQKAVALKLGGYRNRLNGAEDIDLWLRMGQIGLINCLPEPLIKLRKHSNSMTANNPKLGLVCMASRICHLRRQVGLFDPSEGTAEEWTQFCLWLEKKLNQNFYFETLSLMENLRNNFYFNKNQNKFCKTISLLFEATKYPQKFFRFGKIKFFRCALPKKLFLESKEHWPK